MTKLCRGPSHAEPARLPLDARHWHFNRSGARAGLPLARCKQCQNWGKLLVKEGPHGVVAAEPVRAYGRELVERVGSYDRVEALYGIGRTTLQPIVSGERPSVQRRTAQRVLTALATQRRTDRLSAATSKRYLRTHRVSGERTRLIERLQGFA